MESARETTTSKHHIQIREAITMGLRAYLILNVKDDMEQEEYIEGLLELERMVEVDFVDPVVGPYDIMVMVEAPVSVDSVARKIRALNWVKDMTILRIVSVFERHRGSKRDLLQALKRSGV